MDPIVDFIRSIRKTRFEDLPAEAVAVQKRAVVDTVGAAIAGSSAPLGRIVADMARDGGGRNQATVLVHGWKVPAEIAASTNAVMARCLELDDVHEGTKRLGGGHGGHVNTMVVPAALAVAERSSQPISGRQFIVAMALAGDMIVRLRAAAGSVGKSGWSAATVSPFGIVALAAKLMDLDDEIVANAMGAAYAHCAGNLLSVSDGTWDVWLKAGLGPRSGLVAVELAMRGYQGSKSPLLGKAGLFPLYFRGEYLPETLLSELGTVFESANVSIKPYSSCKCTHHAIHTAEELVHRHAIDPQDIERIHVRTCSYNMWLTLVDDKGNYKFTPKNLNEATFSMPFTIATALLKGSVFPDMLAQNLDDPPVLRLARRVTAEVTPEKDAIMRNEGFPPDDVEITTTDGRVFTGCEPYVKGHPTNPMSFGEVVQKFERCISLTAKPLRRGSVDEFLAAAESLETLDDVRGIASRLC